MFELNLGFGWGWAGENAGARQGGRLDGGAGAVR